MYKFVDVKKEVNGNDKGILRRFWMVWDKYIGRLLSLRGCWDE